MEKRTYQPAGGRHAEHEWLKAWLEPVFPQVVAAAMATKLVLFLLMVTFLFGGHG